MVPPICDNRAMPAASSSVRPGRAWTVLIGGSRRGVVTALLAVLVVAAAAVSPGALAVAVGLVVVAFALGWPSLIALPSARGSAAVVLAAGLLSLGAVLWAGTLVPLIAVLAFAVIAAFVHEMGRGQGRTLLTESLAGTVTGAVAASSASGWLAIGVGAQQDAVVLASGASLAAAGLASALPLVPRVTGAIAIVGAAVAGLVVGLVSPTLGALTGAIVGVGVGLVTAALEVIFDRYPAGHRPLGGLTIATIPVVVVGIPVYGVAVLLGA